MKRTAVLLVLCLIALSGCMKVTEPLAVTVTPESGHPPFEVTITALAAGVGTYTFQLFSDQFGDLPYDTITNTDGLIAVTIYIDPRDWHVEVTWTDGNEFYGPVIVRVGLENEAPVIHQPQVTGKSMAIPPPWTDAIRYLEVGQAYTFNFTHMLEYPLYPGYRAREWGIEDPDGDAWQIAEVKCWAEKKGAEAPDSVFTYPFSPDVFWVDGVPGFLVFPWWSGELDNQGRPMAPKPLPWPGNGGYVTLLCFEWNLCAGVKEQAYYVDVTAEDEYGAQSTGRFPYMLAPVGADT